MTTIKWLMLFKKIIAVYTENSMKPITTPYELNAELMIHKRVGTYSYQWALKC
jgi:hypothetical protein